MVNLRPKNDRRRRNWRTSDVSLVASELWFDRGRKPATCCSVIVVKSPYEFEQLRNKYLQPEQCGQILGFDAEWVSAENYLVTK